MIIFFICSCTLCYFCSRVSSQTLSKQFDRTPCCKCWCICTL